MGHVSSHASVKTVFPAPVKWLLWLSKDHYCLWSAKIHFSSYLYKPSAQQHLVADFLLWNVVLQLAKSVSAPSTSPFFSTHNTFCPTSLFHPSLLQTGDEKSMCGCWAPSLRLTSPTPSSPSALPLITPNLLPSSRPVRLTQRHVRRGGDPRACPRRCRTNGHELQQPFLPHHIQGAVQEREEEGWVMEHSPKPPPALPPKNYF